MRNFLFTKLTEPTTVLQKDHRNCQAFGQLNATAESWVLSCCPLFPASSEQKCPISSFPERPGCFADFFSQKLARIIGIVSHVNMKIALTVLTGSWEQLNSIHPGWVRAHEDLFRNVRSEEPASLGLPLTNDTDIQYWAPFELPRLAWFFFF